MLTPPYKAHGLVMNTSGDALKMASEATVSMPMSDNFVFHASMFLGERAFPLYAAFMAALPLPGDVAECGVFMGHTALELALFLKWRGVDKGLHLFDTFSGFPDVATEEERGRFDPEIPWTDLSAGAWPCSLDGVRQFLSGSGNKRLTLYPGVFSQTLPLFDVPLCFIHSDGDLYESTKDVIAFADRVLVPGGVMVIDDYNHPRFPGVVRAVDECLDLARYDFYPSMDHFQGFAVKRGSQAAIAPVIRERVERVALGQLGPVLEELLGEIGKTGEMGVMG